MASDAWADAEAVSDCGCVVTITYGEIKMRACTPEHRVAGRRAAMRFRRERPINVTLMFEHDPPTAALLARKLALDTLIRIWDEESRRPRPEAWFNPRYWVCHREAEFDYPGDGARREPCCDCGETVLVFYDGSCAALIRPRLWICHECGRTRQAANPGWRNARRPAGGLN